MHIHSYLFYTFVNFLFNPTKKSSATWIYFFKNIEIIVINR